jgi:hypothetical protein
MRSQETLLKCLSVVPVTVLVAGRTEWPNALMSAFFVWAGMSILANLLALRRSRHSVRLHVARARRPGTDVGTDIPRPVTRDESPFSEQSYTDEVETMALCGRRVSVERELWADYDDTLRRWEHQRLDTGYSVWK